MEKNIAVKKEYSSLDDILKFVKEESSYTCSLDYDQWDVRTDENNEMEKCVVIKKSAMHAIKVYFSKENTLQVTYMIPNKLLNAYFGKSGQAYKGVDEIILGKIKDLFLAKGQKKAFDELIKIFDKISV